MFLHIVWLHQIGKKQGLFLLSGLWLVVLNDASTYSPIKINANSCQQKISGHGKRASHVNSGESGFKGLFGLNNSALQFKLIDGHPIKNKPR